MSQSIAESKAQARSDREVPVRTPAGETTGSVTLPEVSPAGVRTGTSRSLRACALDSAIDWLTWCHSPRGRP